MLSRTWLPYIALTIGLGVWGPTVAFDCWAQEVASPRQVFDRLFLGFRNGEAYRREDNSKAILVWGEAFFLDALVSMYVGTGDRSYLRRLVQHADSVFANRDDRRGRQDWTGKSRKGWSVNAHYTMGIPQILYDASGKPSLRIQTRRWTGNHQTVLKVTPGSQAGTYRVIARNAFRLKTQIVERFDNLTQETVESRVNAQQHKNRLLRVWRLGPNVPAPVPPFTPPVYRMVFHTHHTGHIVGGIARFVSLVRSQSLLQAEFQSKAHAYTQAIIESLDDFEEQWVDRGDYGYYIIERGAPFWVDGAPEPYNTLANIGRAFLFLWRATGELRFKKRAAKLARLIKKGLHYQDDGTVYWHYWHDKAFEGWRATDNVSTYTPNFSGHRVVETTHYAQPTIRFIVNCYESGLVFTEQDIRALVSTFNTKIWRGDDFGQRGRSGFLSASLTGKDSVRSIGKYDHDVYGWLQLAPYDPNIWPRISRVFTTRFTKNPPNSATYYSWAVLVEKEH